MINFVLSPNHIVVFRMESSNFRRYYSNTQQPQGHKERFPPDHHIIESNLLRGVKVEACMKELIVVMYPERIKLMNLLSSEVEVILEEYFLMYIALMSLSQRLNYIKNSIDKYAGLCLFANLNMMKQ